MKFLKHRAFPAFYKEYAPKLVEFFGLWVDWLNEEDNAAYIVDHLSTEHDIDESVDAYASHIKNKLLDEFPVSIASDLKLLLKNIYFLYNSKSSINSYEFLFRCLFDSPCSIRYPKEYILKTSDGRWQIPVYLQTQGYDIISELWQYNWFKLEGDESGATCYIDGADILKNESGEFENCLRVTSVVGTFVPDEHLTMTDPSTGLVYDFDLYVKKYVINYEAGRWMDTHGLLDSDMVIQDSYYYQDFSYIIRSAVPMNKWKALIKKIIHPAGLGLFGELLTAGTDEAAGNPLTLAATPIAFISMFHMWLKLYVLSAAAALQSATWHLEDSQILQNRSETPDIWIHRGIDFCRDGFYWLNTGYASTFFNRDSVMLFRDDGTLIDPDLIDWSLMKFYDDIDTRTLTGITLHPWKPLDKGEIVGNTWTPTIVMMDTKTIGNSNSELIVSEEGQEVALGNLCLEDDPMTLEDRENLSEMMTTDSFTDTLNPENNESYVYQNFMVFTTQANGDTSKVIKDLRLPDEHISEGKDKTIRSTSIETVAEIPVDKHKPWKELTVNDSVTVSLEQMEIYPLGSLVKVPDDYIAVENGGYRFVKRHYNHEKIFVFSYLKEDVTERHFYENRDHLENHVFSLKANPIDESILLFIDGKFSKNYIVDGTNLIIPASEYNTAELYILGRNIGQRRQEEHYRGDRWFVYNNARKWPFMPHAFHIRTFHAIDYHLWTDLEIDKSYFRIAWNSTMSAPASVESSEMWQELGGIAQNHSITFDEWLNRGEYKSSNSWDQIVSKFNKISNKSSTLVFTEKGVLIDPENINWAEKRISDYADNSPHGEAIIAILEEMAQTLYRWTAYSVPGQRTYNLSGEYDMPSGKSSDYQVLYSSVALDPSDYTINRFSKQITFIDAPQERNYPITVKFIGENVDISDIENKYGNFVYSVPILAAKTRIEFEMDNKSEFTVSVPSKVVGSSDMEQLVSVNEQDVLLGTLDMPSTPMTMENRENLGSVLMTDSFSDTLNTDSEIIRSDYLVFLNGAKVKESEVRNEKNTYIFNGTITGNVKIFQTSDDWKRAYYTGTGTSIEVDKTFGDIDPKYIIVFIDGAYSTDWTISGSTITLKTEPEEWYEVYILNSLSYYQPEKARFDKYSLNFTFNNLRKMDIMPSWMHIYLFKEIQDIGKKIEQHASTHLKNLAIIKNKETSAFASMNIAHQNAEPAIPMYNTMDRLIYDGTQPVLDYENIPVVDVEKEFNKYSTMLFKSDGKIAAPEDINWPATEFAGLTLTDSVTPVILNPEMPALSGTLEMPEGELPHYTPNPEDFFDKNMLVFVTGRKVSPDNVKVENGSIYVSGIENWDVTDTELRFLESVSNEDTVLDENSEDVLVSTSNEEQEILTDDFESRQFQVLNEENLVFVKKDNSVKNITVFQYNPDDVEFMEFRDGSKGRFFQLPRVGFMKLNTLVFKNGYRTDDYYIAGDMLCLNSLEKNETAEVYAFSEYDYNFIKTMPHNYKQKAFIVSNIKRLRYI